MHYGKDNQDIPANTNSKCPLVPIATFNDGHFPSEVRARSIKDLVRVTVVDRRRPAVPMVVGV